MYFSVQAIRNLVSKLTRSRRLDKASVGELIYHLKLPGESVPRAIAQTIVDDPAVDDKESLFPGRIAFGILDEGLIFYDSNERQHQQTRLCRQVNRIGLKLEEMEHPISLIGAFEDRFSAFAFALEAINDLAVREDLMPQAQLGVLVEQILAAFLRQPEAARQLSQHLTSRFSLELCGRLRARIHSAIEEGMNQPPLDDSSPSETLCDPNGPIRFPLSLVEHPNFAQAAWEALDHFSGRAYC